MPELSVNGCLICQWDIDDIDKMETAIDRLSDESKPLLSTMRYIAGLLEVQAVPKYIYLDDDRKIVIADNVELVINRLFIFKLPNGDTATTALANVGGQLFAVPSSKVYDLSMDDEGDIDGICIEAVEDIPDFTKGNITQGYWTITL